MKVGYVQTSPIFGEKHKNFEQVYKLIGKTKADLVILPELFATGYTFISKSEAVALSEKKDGDTTQFLIELARKTGSIVVAGFAEKDGDHIYNSSLIVSDDEVVGTYRKIHLYANPLHS